MKWVKLISFLGVLAMTAVLFFGFTQGNFFEDGGKLMENPWGIVSLVDLYTGFLLFAVWIVYRESGILPKVIWVVLTLEEKQLKMNRQIFKTLNSQSDSRFYFGKN